MQQNRQQSHFRSSFLTLDSTLTQQNNSFLYFRPQLGPNDSSGSQFFSLQPAIGTDPSIRINQHASDGTILATGYLIDSLINPTLSPDPTFSTVTILGRGVQPLNVFDVSCGASAFQINNLTADRLRTNILQGENSAFGGSIDFIKSRGGTTTLPNDELGYLSFYGTTTGNTPARGAYIIGRQDGTDVSGNLPGRIEFHTSSTSSTDNECMRIDSSCNVGIGTSAPYIRLQTAVNQKTALDGIAAVSSDVNTIIGAYNSGLYTGLNTGSIQATSGSSAFNNYKLALNPRGGDVYVGDGSGALNVYATTNVGVPGTGTPYIYLEGSAGQGRVYDTVYNLPPSATTFTKVYTTSQNLNLASIPSLSSNVLLTIRAIGGGGGGGAGYSAVAALEYGGGGGGSGYEELISIVVPNTTILNITIGTGGAGGTWNPYGAGGNGTATIITLNGLASSTIISAAGGGGASTNNAINGGNGYYGGGGGGMIVNVNPPGTPGIGGTGSQTYYNGQNGDASGNGGNGGGSLIQNGGLELLSGYACGGGGGGLYGGKGGYYDSTQITPRIQPTSGTYGGGGGGGFGNTFPDLANGAAGGNGVVFIQFSNVV